MRPVMTAVMAGSRPRAEPSRMTTLLAPLTHDLSGAAPRTEDVLSLVDALVPGQLLALRLSAKTSRALLATLTAERKGLFEWSPEADGNAVRVDVVRRDAAPGSKRGVFEALSWDHDRIDAFEQGAFTARAAGDFEAARALFDRFARGLFRHIGFEEDLLFPALESAAGLSPHVGPTAVMRAEHVEIRAAVQLLRDAIGDPLVDPTPLRHRLHGAHHRRGPDMGGQPRRRFEGRREEVLLESNVPEKASGEPVEKRPRGLEVARRAGGKRALLERVDAVVVPAQRLEDAVLRARSGVPSHDIDSDGVPVRLGAPLERAFSFRGERREERPGSLGGEAQREELPRDERVHERKDVLRTRSGPGEIVRERSEECRHSGRFGPGPASRHDGRHNRPHVSRTPGRS